MKDKNHMNMAYISICCSVIAIFICLGLLIYEYISKENDYTIWLILLLANFSILCANISNRKK